MVSVAASAAGAAFVAFLLLVMAVSQFLGSQRALVPAVPHQHVRRRRHQRRGHERPSSSRPSSGTNGTSPGRNETSEEEDRWPWDVLLKASAQQRCPGTIARAMAEADAQAATVTRSLRGASFPHRCPQPSSPLYTQLHADIGTLGNTSDVSIAALGRAARHMRPNKHVALLLNCSGSYLLAHAEARADVHARRCIGGLRETFLPLLERLRRKELCGASAAEANASGAGTSTGAGAGAGAGAPPPLLLLLNLEAKATKPRPYPTLSYCKAAGSGATDVLFPRYYWDEEKKWSSGGGAVAGGGGGTNGGGGEDSVSGGGGGGWRALAAYSAKFPAATLGRMAFRLDGEAHEWTEKAPTAVFRGTATHLSRVALAALSNSWNASLRKVNETSATGRAARHAVAVDSAAAMPPPTAQTATGGAAEHSPSPRARPPPLLDAGITSYSGSVKGWEHSWRRAGGAAEVGPLPPTARKLIMPEQVSKYKSARRGPQRGGRPTRGKGRWMAHRWHTGHRGHQSPALATPPTYPRALAAQHERPPFVSRAGTLSTPRASAGRAPTVCRRCCRPTRSCSSRRPRTPSSGTRWRGRGATTHRWTRAGATCAPCWLACAPTTRSRGASPSAASASRALSTSTRCCATRGTRCSRCTGWHRRSAGTSSPPACISSLARDDGRSHRWLPRARRIDESRDR